MKWSPLVVVGFSWWQLLALGSCHRDAPAPIPVAPPGPTPPTVLSPSPWVAQASSHVLSGLNGLRFWNAENGWLLGGYYVPDALSTNYQPLRTENGGTTWTEPDLIALHLSNGFLDLYPVTDQVLYATGDDKTLLTTNSSRFLYKSTDGGRSWQQLPRNGYQGSKLTFVTEQVGFACDATGIRKTTDGGQSWHLAYDAGISFGDSKLQMLTADLGFAEGGMLFDQTNTGLLLRTTDGGETWQDLHWMHKSINDFTFLSASVGLLTTTVTHGSGATYQVTKSLYKTADGGLSWQLLNANTPTGIYAFVSEQEFYCAGTGIQHTRDGGATWVLEYALPTKQPQDHFQTLVVLPTGIGYAASAQGSIVKRP